MIGSVSEVAVAVWRAAVWAEVGRRRVKVGSRVVGEHDVRPEAPHLGGYTGSDLHLGHLGGRCVLKAEDARGDAHAEDLRAACGLARARRGQHLWPAREAARRIVAVAALVAICHDDERHVGSMGRGLEERAAAVHLGIVRVRDNGHDALARPCRGVDRHDRVVHVLIVVKLCSCENPEQERGAGGRQSDQRERQQGQAAPSATCGPAGEPDVLQVWLHGRHLG